jgi:hypothetical protein
MDETQQTSLKALLEVECKMSEDETNECDGPWCTARKNIIAAFELSQEPATEEASAKEDTPTEA